MVSELHPPHDSQVLRQQMAGPLDALQFLPPLEHEFAHELRNQQRRSALFTVSFLGVIWLFFAGLDWWRLHLTLGTGNEWRLVWGVMAQRWLVLVCLLCTLYALLQPRTSVATHTRWIVACIISGGCGVVLSSYMLKTLGLPEASMVTVLAVVVALYPLGVRLRYAVVAATVVCMFATMAGPWLLTQPADLAEHWIRSAILWATLVLSGVTAYFREKAIRQQFILQKLLDWEACHDPLTGLMNRRMLREQFPRSLLQAKREQHTLFLALIDIDHFKLYNDLYGHKAGDEVLRRVGGLLGDYARRPLDLAVRLGGEEFALVLYDESADALGQRMAQLFKDLHALNLPHDASPTAPYVTVSIGLVQVRDGDALETVFKLADSLLDQAKKQGRNQVCGAISLSIPVVNPRRPSWAQQASAQDDAL